MRDGKYVALTKHLRAQAAQTVTLSFGQLKSILGFGLPASAGNHRPWWGNHHGNPQARGWMDAGWLVESVNLHSQLVRFSRKNGAIAQSAPAASRGIHAVTQERSSAAILKTEPPDAVANDCHVDIDDLKTSITELGRLAGCDFAYEDIRVHWSGAPHKRPSPLQPGLQAVYCFFVGEHCLKVGKAGPNSSPRFVSHHYFINAPSTLAKSILGSKDRVAELLREELKDELRTTDEKLIGEWIERNTGRLNILIPSEAGPHALSLVEAFMHCRFQPLFEGHA